MNTTFNNQELSKALATIGEGFTMLSKAVLTDIKVVPNEPKVKSPEKTTEKKVEPKKEESKVTPIKEAPKKEVEETTEGGVTRESLEAMSYNEIKALAKENGAKAVGTKASIIDALLEILGEAEPEAEDTTETDVEDNEEDIEDVDTESDDEEEEEDTTFYDQVVADLEDYTDEELADILSDVGISPKGKRQALLAKIVQAIEDGKIEWEDNSEGEEAETEDSAPEETEVEDTSNEEEAEEYDFVTEARKDACMELEKDLRKQFKTKKLTHKEILKALKEIDPEYVSEGVEADLDIYIETRFDLVDEDGDIHEEGEAYYIGDQAYCCGVALQEVDGEFVCEVCGETYSAE